MMENHTDRADAEKQPDICFNGGRHILRKAMNRILSYSSGIDQKTGPCFPADRIGLGSEETETVKDVSVHVDPSGA